VGGVGVGLGAVGGLAAGVLTAVGGGAVGGVAVGGAAIGILAMGSGAVGVWAQGAGAVGVFARDVSTWRRGGRVSPPGFEAVTWFFGQWPPDAMSLLVPVVTVVALPLLCAAAIGWVAWRAIRAQARAEEQTASSRAM
jgi:hypothetical protein